MGYLHYIHIHFSTFFSWYFSKHVEPLFIKHNATLQVLHMYLDVCGFCFVLQYAHLLRLPLTGKCSTLLNLFSSDTCFLYWGGGESCGLEMEIRLFKDGV